MIFRDFIRKPMKDRRGNVAIITAMISMVMISLLGGVIDLGTLYSKRASAQDALDAAALAAAASPTTDPATMQTLTTQMFKANTQVAPEAAVATFAYNSSTQTITTTASGTYTPVFAQLVGVHQLTYSVQSTANRKIDGTLEIALVLDNTYSMSDTLDGTQSKITVLKQAAKNLISTVMTPTNTANGGVKLSVVPYAEYVNVGLNNRNATWLSVLPDTSVTTTKQNHQDAVPLTCTTVTQKQVCTGGQLGTCSSSTNHDGVVSTSTYSCWIVPQTCSMQAVTPYQSCTGGTPAKDWTTTSTTTTTWFGCVLNQVQAGKLMMPDPLTPYVGIMETNSTTNHNCLTPILPLTSDTSAANNAITALVTSNPGNPTYYPETYIPGGLVWGVNTLSPEQPFQAAAYDPKKVLPRKVMILMTDGANTRYLNSNGTLSNAYDSNNNLTSAGTANLPKTYTDQDSACQYAKNKGIEVYTIGFGVNDPSSLAHLQSCATDASHYFPAQSSAALTSAFKVIAGNLSKVRIAH